MRACFRVSVLAAALLAAAIVGGCSDDEDVSRPAVSGIVLDSSGQPVAGAGILIEYTFGDVPKGDKPATRISFQVPEPETVRLWITGPCADHTVRVLVDGELPAGSHSIVWNGLNDAGQIVPAGMYTVHIQTPRDRSEFPIFMPGSWPPAPPLESREWLAMTDADGRFTIPLACQAFGESMVETDETGTQIGTLTIQNEARVWAVHPDLGTISTGDFVAVNLNRGAQVELRYIDKE